MAQQTTTRFANSKPALPKRRDVFLHAVKTSKLIGSLTGDRRVSITRKIFFFVIVLGLLAILAFPDLIDETVLSVILPFVGTIVGIPIDIGFDWAAFALVVVSLFKIFPAEVVEEHYRRIFNRYE